MGALWAVISLMAVWLLYGLLASIFVKGINSRDALPLLFSGMIGGGIDKLQKTFGPAIQKQLEEDGITMPKFLAHKYTGQLHSNEANKPNRMLEEEKDA